MMLFSEDFIRECSEEELLKLRIALKALNKMEEPMHIVTMREAWGDFLFGDLDD